MTAAAITSEIQKLSPSSVIELFVLDLALFGQGPVRFHAGTNALQQRVVWQGNAYEAFPIEVEGFELNGNGQVPRPRLRVANVTGAITALVLNAFQSNLVFFYSPTQVAAHEAPVGRTFRIGGLVEEGSVKRDQVEVEFVVTDTVHETPVRYSGLLPDLFKEGKGVVAQGKLDEQGLFVASEVLAKHDENYMPPEAQHALDQAAAAKAAQTVKP